MIEKAIFSLGCFWGPEHYFSRLPGVVSTRVGYTGGKKPDPTYEDLGDHSEAVEITFDPAKISYKELLRHFWQEHDPTADQPRQYRSAIYYLDETQRASAVASLQTAAQNYQDRILTALEKAGIFYPAEEYHQKYIDRRNR